MEKKQLAAALALGAVMGMGGTQMANRLAAETLPPPYVHAVDVRRALPRAEADGGTSVPGVYFDAYATQYLPDGGHKDIGKAGTCKPTEATKHAGQSLLDALAHECSW